MNIETLINQAAIEARSQRKLAELLDVHPNMVTYWKSGKHKPSATQIAQLAEVARLPVLETVAEVEAELDEGTAEIWKRALRALRGAGVAAGLAAALVTATLGKAEAAPLYKTELCSQCTYVL